MALDIIIIGSGGFAREVYQWARSAFDASNYKIKGFLSPRANELDPFEIEPPILGDENSYEIQENDRFLIGIGNSSVNRKIVSVLKKKGAQFLTLVHSTAIVADNCKLGEGVILCPNTLLTDSVMVGDFSIINLYASCGHDATVGNYCVLSPYATLNGGAVLEDDVFMATHTMVANGKRVGKGAVVGANSIVIHDVAPGEKVIGRSSKPDPAISKAG